MKLLVAAITFVATLGMLFLIEAGKSPKEDYAQIIEALKEGSTNATVSATPSPIKTQFRTPAPTQTPAKTPSPTPPPISSSSSPIPSTAPATLTPTPTPPSLPQETGQGFIDIASITSPVKQNSTAQLSISTLPNAYCSIIVTLPSGNQSAAKGLEAKTADASGDATWSWKINWNTTTGTATIKIGCSKDGQSFSKSLQMVIVER